MAVTRQMIIFELNQEEFGIDINNVNEIIRPEEIRPVPQSSDFIAGIINLRGEIIIIVDLRKKFGLQAEVNSDTRIIVAELAETKVGFIVDDASEVLRVEGDEIAPPPKQIEGIQADLLQGVVKRDERLIILLDFAGLLSKQEVEEIQQVGQEVD
ncbi:chemotaxis protein CheW [Natroniella sulfidigena]|uniref:chemotaxis protein CheW n=1 Tax=Natroniella sulfidigena TaxID=723921 RepID=UPI00200A85A7|nr:chemotaxis protein CheW [Natroniella sulfidigena]MCK8816339.1 chemotaxis protein CheW [Natroniella sulfidigena]